MMAEARPACVQRTPRITDERYSETPARSRLDRPTDIEYITPPEDHKDRHLGERENVGQDPPART